jgi:formylglycine-generating enzyme required for sulfatase activity/serine/threonine protein kinase
MSNFKNHNAEHNLIFAGLGLQLGIIAKDKVIRAFTEWLFDKARPLGEILVHQKAITPEQMKTLESAVDAHIQQEGGEQKALASLKNVRALEDELNHLDDEDINNTILPAVTSQKGTLGIPQPFPTSPPTPTGDSQGIIDRFERGAFLDAGNLGELFFAKDKELNRIVVTKYIKPKLANEQRHQALFHLEGEVTGALEHPSIVPVYGLNKDSRDRLYYAMRYIPGRKLTRVIQEYHRISHSEKESKREAFMSLLQNFHAACLAIEYAHIKGVLHCDIKPDNIMVGDFGEVFVVDWGLAVVQNKNTETQSPDPQMTTDEGQIPTFRPSESAARGLHINQGGSRYGVGGTPAYMAPEQFQATKLNDISLIGPPSDIYGLGATLYHITTGKAPHLPIKQPKEILDDFYGRIMAGKFPTPIEMNTTTPIYLNAIVMKAMALNPKKRYTSARDLAEDVKWFMANNPVTAYETPLHEKQKSEAVTNELLFNYETQEISLSNPILIDKNAKDLPMDLASYGPLIPRKADVRIRSIPNRKPDVYSINPDPLMDNAVQCSHLPMDRSVDDNIKSHNASLKASNFLYYGLVLIIIFIVWGVCGGSGWTLTGERFVGITVVILFLGVCFKLWKNHLKGKLVDQVKDESVVVPDDKWVGEFAPAENVDYKSAVAPLKVDNQKIPDTKIIIEMALVPAGKFMMGSPASEKDRSYNETQHEVTLTKPFYMGKYEVTQEQWESVMGKNPSREKGAKLPVTDVSWIDCQVFIHKLNASTKGGYRLPTEAEWEYACRAGTTTAYSFGAKVRLKNLNYADLKMGKPVAVGSYKPNAFGLYDMHGNVFEWCEDWYGDYPEGGVTDPKGPAFGENHVLRGGAFSFQESLARSSFRGNYPRAVHFNFLGFRLVRTP